MYYSFSVLTEQRNRRAYNWIPVAFDATIAEHHIEHIGMNQIVVFDLVIENIGNAYNRHTGTFVAPVDGIYVFSAALTSPSDKSFLTRFVKNGGGFSAMYASGFESGGSQTTSNTVVHQLRQDDVVCIVHEGVDKMILGYGLSTFSGFLLY